MQHVIGWWHRLGQGWQGLYSVLVACSLSLAALGWTYAAAAVPFLGAALGIVQFIRYRRSRTGAYQKRPSRTMAAGGKRKLIPYFLALAKFYWGRHLVPSVIGLVVVDAPGIYLVHLDRVNHGHTATFLTPGNGVLYISILIGVDLLIWLRILPGREKS